MFELDILSILFIAFGLSADCFAVALSGSVAMKSLSRLQVFRTALTFGVFQAIMPVLGWLAGKTFVDIIADYDHWIAFSLLLLVGGRMIWKSCYNGEKHKQIDITKGILLITLAVATSIDALAVGLTFAFLRVNIIVAVSIIGITAFLVTAFSFVAGRKLGSFAGKRAEAIGGIILIAVGLRIVLSHLL
jgi:putative Mn2+ efflux pump MntP